MNKYYFFYKCYWNSFRSNKRKPYFSVFFNYKNNENIIKRNIKKKTKHSKIIMLAKSKLSSIESLMSQALLDLGISHEDLKIIVHEKEKYDQMKESIRNKKNENIVKIHKLTKKIFFYFVLCNV